MRRLWHDIRTHRLAVALFGLYWLTTAVITVVIWNQGVPDRVWWVPHVLVAVAAGTLVAWWRNAEVDAVGASAAVGALVGALNILAQGVAYGVARWLSNSPPVVVAVESAADEEPGWLFIIVLTIVTCLIGGVLGALGWVVAGILMPLARWLRGRGGPAMPTGTH
jgi:hypothetical protein